MLAGSYTISITDSLGCISYDTLSVSDNPSPVITGVTATNVSCFGGNDGTAEVNAVVLASGAPYTYSWLPSGGTNITASGLTAGTYTVTVKDVHNCLSIPTESPEIYQPLPIYTNITQTNVNCIGGSDGSAAAIVSGGTPDYSYIWLSNGTTATSLLNLSAGTDTIQVTDANSCVQKTPYTITEPTILSVSKTFTPVSCFGGADGSISSAASGGTSPYKFNWMPGGLIGEYLYNLTAGTYTVTITDLNECTIIDSVHVTQPSLAVLTSSSINSKCSLPNGKAYVSVSGGTAPYLYQWSPTGDTNDTAYALLSGIYSVTVTDSNKCNSTISLTINDNPSPIVTVFSTTNVSCSGGTNGSASIAISGTSGPFTYSWAPSGITDSTAVGLQAGTYTVTVMDTNLCNSLPLIIPEITEPPPILITINKTPVSCFSGTNGSAAAIPTGGTPGFTYLWQGGTTNSSLTNISAGTYTVQVTDTNSCVQITPFSITQPPAVLSDSLSFNPVLCFGGADGSVSAFAEGGTPPYNYFWMPGPHNGQNISNLSIGTYTVTIIDSKGCSVIDLITVTQPAIVILTGSSKNSNCSEANGQAYVSVIGGVLPYLYQWSPSSQTNDTAFSLLSGAYIVSVTDSNECVSAITITVNDNPSPSASVSSTTNVGCSGGSDGTATAAVIGTSGPFTYMWMPSGGTNLTATGLTAGYDTLIVSDANLCQSFPAISPEIMEPALISIAVTTSPISCFGGSNGTASANASGGTPGYTYEWLPNGTQGPSLTNIFAGNYHIKVTDNKGCIQIDSFTITEPTLLTSSISPPTDVRCFGDITGSANVIVSGGTPVYSFNWQPLGGNGPIGTGLSVGTFTVTVTDLNGCKTKDSVTINEPPQALSAVYNKSFVTCFGLSDGTAGIHAAGGVPGYSYQWNPLVSINDTASGLSAGVYFVTITDTNSCQTNLSISISQPEVLGGTMAAVNPSCGSDNGSLFPQISGGTYPYTYLWSPGGSTNYGINSLAQGVYSVQITDSLNCSLSLTANITNIPIPIVTVSSTNDVSCSGGNDGSAAINIAGGTAPYIINWSPAGGNNLTASALTVGTYTVNIIDFDGCQKSDSAVITEPTPIVVTVDSVRDVLCFGENTGLISVSASGGTGALYNYLWTPITSNLSTVNNLAAGSYTVNVMDQNNCIKSISAAITQPALLSSTIDSIFYPTCFNGRGSASVIAFGGVIPYSYSWTPAGDPGSTANNLLADSYTVTITDAHGCSNGILILLTQPSQVITTAGVNDTLCLGQSGLLSAAASGGAGNYYYTWQPSGAITLGTLPVTPTSDITYNVAAYDQNGCAGTSASATAIVFTLDTSVVHVYATSPVCPGQASVVYAETSGITGELTYQWNNNLGPGPGVFVVTPSQPTTYIVTVSNVCKSVTDSVKVLINPPPIFSAASDTNSLCVPGTIQFFDNSVSGYANDPITLWNWSFGDGTYSTEEDPGHSYTLPFNYPVTLTVTTSGGCTSNNTSAPFFISGHPYPVAAFSLSSTDLVLPFDILNCYNQSTEAITNNWSFGDGGTSALVNPSYSYSTIGVFQVQLIAMTQYGCLDTATAEVTTNTDIAFPNAFTPNPDGSQGGYFDINSLDNNIFFTYTSGVVEYKLEIYDRWGEMIFESTDIKLGWDGYYKGQICPQDVYIWKAFIKLNTGKIFEKNGNLTLLR